MFTVEAGTVGGKKSISAHRVHWEDDGGPGETRDANEHQFSFLFGQRETADSVAKALAHAARRCGAGPE